MDWQVLTFNHGLYIFPDWTNTLGWVILSLLLVAIPLLAIVTLFQASGKTIFQVNNEKQLQGSVSAHLLIHAIY